MGLLRDVVLDNATARLVAAARASQAAEHLPKESARSLVGLGRGVRLYVEALQTTMALHTLDEVDKMAGTIDDDDLRNVYLDLTTAIRKALKR